MSDEGNMEDPGSPEGFDPLGEFPWEAFTGQPIILEGGEEQPCGRCRSCILSVALGFVADVTSVHTLPEEPWTSSSGNAAAFGSGTRLVTTAAEHALELAMRVADWILDVEVVDE